MPKYKVIVCEAVIVTYAPVEIEAEDEEHAEELAEEMRVQGDLTDPSESVDDIVFETKELV